MQALGFYIPARTDSANGKYAADVSGLAARKKVTAPVCALNNKLYSIVKKAE